MMHVSLAIIDSFGGKEGEIADALRHNHPDIKLLGLSEKTVTGVDSSILKSGPHPLLDVFTSIAPQLE